MKIFQILSNIDRRVIYLLLSISVITPMIIKIEMPIAPDQYAQTAYNAISEKFEEYPSSDRKILLSISGFGEKTIDKIAKFILDKMEQLSSDSNGEADEESSNDGSEQNTEEVESL